MSIAGFFKSIFGGGKSEASEAKEAPAAPAAESTSDSKFVSESVSISSQPEGTVEEIPVTISRDVESAGGSDDGFESAEDEFFDEDAYELPHFETLEVFGGIGGYVGPILTKDRVGVKGTRRLESIGKPRNSVEPRVQHGGAPGSSKARGGAPAPRNERGGAPTPKR